MNKMNLEEATIKALQGKLTESNQTKFYHYDSDTYKVGDIISKSYNYTYKEIVDVYKEIVGIDVSQLVYMLNYIDDTYEDGTYKFRYEVDPVNMVICGNLDCSPIMCDEFLQKYAPIYNNYNDKQTLINIISTFARAYIGNEDDLAIISGLGEMYSNKKEYITNRCEVKQIVEI